MRGLHPRTPVLFSSCWNTTLCSAGKGKHRAAPFPSCCWSGSAAALVSPLTPFPGISAVVLNLMLIYQPQAAQGGIFLARRSAARLKIKQPGGAQSRSTPALQGLFCFLRYSKQFFELLPNPKLALVNAFHRVVHQIQLVQYRFSVAAALVSIALRTRRFSSLRAVSFS